MKARTKAAKLRQRKGGRPRTEGAPREASGKVDRKWAAAKTTDDVMRTGVTARMRLFGVTYEEAKSQEGGTVIGRMLLAKEITIDQFRAAERYAEVKNAYQRAIGAVPDAGRPPPPPMFETGASDFESFCKQARATWSGETVGGIRTKIGVVDVLQQVMIENRNLCAVVALDAFITRDTYQAPLVGDLRIALNALHRHFTQERRRGA